MNSRRDFLVRAGAVCSVGAVAPGVWRRAARAAEARRDGSILVVVELTGGNDGLNTVVPFEDDVDRKSRPTLALKPEKTLKLDDQTGLNDALKDLHSFWESGDLAVIRQVGYPNPNRSHFESMAIWQTGVVGSPPPVGWLGRAADSNPGLAIRHVGPTSVPLAVQGRKTAPQSLAGLADFHLAPGAELAFEGRPGETDPTLGAIRARYRGARELLERLDAMPKSAGAIPAADTIQGRLETIRRLITADASTRVYYTSLDGFDTHSSQIYAHPRLLRSLAEGIAGFFNRLKDDRLADRAAVLVFSEFGRRLKENAGGGTDHGAPGPVLLVGPGVKGGLVGPPPDLTRLDDVGDPFFAVDYRDVLGAVLRGWLDVDPTPVLGERSERMDLFG